MIKFWSIGHIRRSWESWDCLALDQWRLRSDFSNTYNTQREGSKRIEPGEDAKRLFSVMLKNRTRGYGHKLKHRRCFLSIRRVSEHRCRLPREVVESPSAETLTQNPTGLGPEKTAVAEFHCLQEARDNVAQLHTFILVLSKHCCCCLTLNFFGIFSYPEMLSLIETLICLSQYKSYHTMGYFWVWSGGWQISGWQISHFLAKILV